MSLMPPCLLQCCYDRVKNVSPTFCAELRMSAPPDAFWEWFGRRGGDHECKDPPDGTPVVDLRLLGHEWICPSACRKGQIVGTKEQQWPRAPTKGALVASHGRALFECFGAEKGRLVVGLQLPNHLKRIHLPNLLLRCLLSALWVNIPTAGAEPPEGRGPAF